MVLGSIVSVAPLLVGSLGFLGAGSFLQTITDTGLLGGALDWAESIGMPVCRECNPWLNV